LNRDNFIPFLPISAQTLVRSSTYYNDWGVSGFNYHVH
jgi:hypothetical protein